METGIDATVSRWYLIDILFANNCGSTSNVGDAASKLVSKTRTLSLAIFVETAQRFNLSFPALHLLLLSRSDGSGKV